MLTSQQWQAVSKIIPLKCLSCVDNCAEYLVTTVSQSTLLFITQCYILLSI